MNENEKTIKVLENYFNGFINQTKHWHFFLGLSDYVSFVLENSFLSKLIKEFEKQKKFSCERVDKLNDITIKELEKTGKEIFNLIDKNNIKIERIENKRKDFNLYLKGGIVGSNPKPVSLNDILFHIAIILKEDNYPNLLKKYERKRREGENRNIYGHYTFSKTLNKRNEEEDILRRKREMDMWGMWESIYTAYDFVSGNNKLEKEIRNASKNDLSMRWSLLNIMGVKGELERMKDKSRLGFMKEEDNYTYFCPQNFQNKVIRLNNYFIKELSKLEDKKSEKEKSKKFIFKFDKEKSILNFDNVKINIRKFSNQYHLLKIIDENNLDINNETFFSEISEFFERSNPKSIPDKKFYNATYQINQKIAKETKIKDYFLTTNQSFKINPDYIKKF